MINPTADRVQTTVSVVVAKKQPPISDCDENYETSNCTCQNISENRRKCHHLDKTQRKYYNKFFTKHFQSKS